MNAMLEFRSDARPRARTARATYLDGAKFIQPLTALDSGPRVMVVLRVTDHTHRFERDHG